MTVWQKGIFLFAEYKPRNKHKGNREEEEKGPGYNHRPFPCFAKFTDR